MPECLHMDCTHSALLLFMHKAGGVMKVGVVPFLIRASLSNVCLCGNFLAPRDSTCAKSFLLLILA